MKGLNYFGTLQGTEYNSMCRVKFMQQHRVLGLAPMSEIDVVPLHSRKAATSGDCTHCVLQRWTPYQTCKVQHEDGNRL